MIPSYLISDDFLNHSFFKSYRHFINYCFKISRSRGLIEIFGMNEEDLTNLFYYYAWTVKNQNYFTRLGVIPPYQTLIDFLKSEDADGDKWRDIELMSDELVSIINNEKTINECPYIFKNKADADVHISGKHEIRLFSEEYLALIEDCDGKCGIYKLYDNNKELKYVGKSYDLSHRVPSSSKANKSAYVSVMYTTTLSDASLLEVYYICKEKPPNNKESFSIDKLTMKISHKYKFSPLIKIFKA